MSTLPPPARLIRRIAAYLVDVAILFVIGTLLTLVGRSFWYSIGPYGRLVGSPIELLYFGLLDSRIGAGRTVGKRLLGIVVSDAQGMPIGVGRSMLRTLVWVVPATLDGWSLPIFGRPIPGAVAGVIIFGIGGAMLITMLFNRRSRQGLHDMLTGSYVLRPADEPVAVLPKAARAWWILCGSVVLVAVLMNTVGFRLLRRLLPQMTAIESSLNGGRPDERFFVVTVTDEWSAEGDPRKLVVRAWCKGPPAMAKAPAIEKELLAVAHAVPNLGVHDLIRTELTWGYDLGIARSTVTHKRDWEARDTR